MDPLPQRPSAVFIDAGGVLLLPDPATVLGALVPLGLAIDADRVAPAHYAAVRAVDADGGELTVGGLDHQYLPAFVERLQVPLGRRTQAVQGLGTLFGLPASQLWTTAHPRAVEGLRLLRRSGARLAVVSNADGSVEELLASTGVCQVGPGQGVEVAAVIDSGLIGVEKPDPRIFAAALEATGLSEPDGVVHVGDSKRYDVAGAEAAGTSPVHVDPYRLCTDGGHPHVADLLDLASRLDLPDPAGPDREPLS